MNIFDIIGPIMVGPSSSHTSGVVRIGNVVHKILGATPVKIRIIFYGSFATTYLGHGSDKAIIGGIMGYTPDDENIKRSLSIAKENNIDFTITTSKDITNHPNTVSIFATDDTDKTVNIIGESIGGGNILIRKIDNIEVEFTGQYDTLIINHTDIPGAISIVTNLLMLKSVNIANMKVYRSQKHGDAMMIIETDESLDKSLEKIVENLPHIKSATVLPGLNHTTSV